MSLKNIEEFNKLIKSAETNPYAAKIVADIYNRGLPELKIKINHNKAIKYYKMHEGHKNYDTYNYMSIAFIYMLHMVGLGVKDKEIYYLEKFVNSNHSKKYMGKRFLTEEYFKKAFKKNEKDFNIKNVKDKDYLINKGLIYKELGSNKLYFKSLVDLILTTLSTFSEILSSSTFPSSSSSKT